MIEQTNIPKVPFKHFLAMPSRNSGYLIWYTYAVNAKNKPLSTVTTSVHYETEKAHNKAIRNFIKRGYTAIEK